MSRSPRPALDDLNSALAGPAGPAQARARRRAEELFGASQRLIVYGSLAPGRTHHDQVRSLGGEWTRGWITGDLLSAGWGAELGYPALRPRADGPRVDAWLLTSPELPDAWNRLDEFEGAAYRRTLAPFETDAGVVAVGYVYAAAVSATRVSRHLDAPPSSVYRALLDPRAVATWMVPDGMTGQVHAFDPREGGRFRISLSYEQPTGTGKTTAHTDTYHGRFVTLVPNEQVVEVMEFETADEAMRGEMTVTLTLAKAGRGTDLLAVHANVPPGISPADNEAGWRMALDKLAAYLGVRGAEP